MQLFSKKPVGFCQQCRVGAFVSNSNQVRYINTLINLISRWIFIREMSQSEVINFLLPYCSLTFKGSWVWWQHTCNPNDLGSRGRRTANSRPVWQFKENVSQYFFLKGWGCSSVVKHPRMERKKYFFKGKIRYPSHLELKKGYNSSGICLACMRPCQGSISSKPSSPQLCKHVCS